MVDKGRNNEKQNESSFLVLEKSFRIDQTENM